jgi:hypothetical protein
MAEFSFGCAETLVSCIITLIADQRGNEFYSRVW